MGLLQKNKFVGAILTLLLFSLFASCSSMSHQERIGQEYKVLGAEYNELARKYYNFQVSPEQLSGFILRCDEFVSKCGPEDAHCVSLASSHKSNAQVWKDEVDGWVRFCSDNGIDWSEGGFATYLSSIAGSSDIAEDDDLHLIARAKLKSDYGSVIGHGWTSYAKEQERIRLENERIRLENERIKRESEEMVSRETAEINKMIARLEKSERADDAYELVRLYRNGKSITTPDSNSVMIVSMDEEKAKSYLKKAADLGSVDAVLELVGEYDGGSYPSDEQISLMNRVVRFSDEDKHKCSGELAFIIALFLNSKILDTVSGDKDKEFSDWLMLSGEILGEKSGADNIRKKLAEIDKLEKSVRESSFKQGTAFEKLMEEYKEMYYFDRLYKSVSGITDTGIGCYYMAFIKANGITSDGKFTNDGDVYSAADYFHNARYYKNKKANEIVEEINGKRYVGDFLAEYLSVQASDMRKYFESVIMTFYAGDANGSFDSKMDQMCASSLKIFDNPVNELANYMKTEKFWKDAGMGLYIQMVGGFEIFRRLLGI